MFHFQSLCYDLFSTSFELQLVKHLRFKMTNTTMFRNAVFGLKALFLDDNPPSLRKGFSLAKRAEALNFSFEKYRSYRETNQFLLKVIIGNMDVRRLLFMSLSKLQTSIF